MTGKVLFKAILILAISLLFHGCEKTGKKAAADTVSSEKDQQVILKPYRVLIIIGDQWTDPMSYNIDPARVNGTDFLDVVNMLKIWGVPFDILRLDEQRLQINRFLDGEAKPSYGCIIWMADPCKLKGKSAEFRTLKRAVEEYGISMIALFDYISNREVAGIAGLNYTDSGKFMPGENRDKFSVTGLHFITSGTGSFELPDPAQSAAITIPEANGITPDKNIITGNSDETRIINCSADKSVKVLGSVGDIPQLTVKDLNKNTSVTWIGGGKNWFRRYPVMRNIFRKALVYSIGYGVFNDNFENGFIFIMDDIGCAEHTYSLRWHYPTPARDTLLKYLIEPLEKYGKMMVQNITPGYANIEKKMIGVPWSVKPFTDVFGNWQDFGSTKEGLDEGLRRGVFEIQAHRAWSHMNWDPDSPPGPWWGSEIDGELAVTDWYNEVVDVRRDNAAVPSNDLLFIYKTGIDAIKKAFGVTPLAAEVRPGAELKPGKPGGFDNGRIAAIAGIGVSRECYVGYDHTIEFTMMMPVQYTCHDLDLTARTNFPADETEAGWDKLLKMDTEQLKASKIAGGRRINLHDNLQWIESRKDKYWMGFNETCAYLHANIINLPGNRIGLEYDDHYCSYFNKKTSHWTLEFSDSFIEGSGKNASLSVDGKMIHIKPGTMQLIEIPAGLGKHTIEIKK